MKIKICGITNLCDALNAIDAGANALGFVFYPQSQRYIDPQKAKNIISQLPPFVQSVGLFVNEVAPKIDFIAKLTSIDIVQIHFDADQQFYNHLQTKSLKVIRAKSKQDIIKFSNEYRIVDAYVDNFGGEGKRLELSWFDNIDCSKIILAGGLDANNLNEIKGYNFYGVDVSSGVEKSKGKKDHTKMINFINSANEIFR